MSENQPPTDAPMTEAQAPTSLDSGHADIVGAGMDKAAYRATTGRVSGKPDFIRFVPASRTGIRIRRFSDIMEMEPADSEGGKAYIHFFSGLSIILHAFHSSLILFRVEMGRCSAIHEAPPMTQAEIDALAADDVPVVTKMEFRMRSDEHTGKPPPTKKHEPETLARQGEKAT